MKKPYYYMIIIISLILCSSLFIMYKTKNGAGITNKEITISAASSLKEPLDKLANLFQNENKVKINMNYGASGILQKQIQQGAPVDIFISAGKAQMDILEKEKLIDSSSKKDLLYNSLVLIVSSSYDKNINSIAQLKGSSIKLGIGEVKTVPAGQYALEYLKSEGIYDDFKSNIIYCKDVKEVLTYTETGNVQAGIVYYSDAAKLKNSYIAYYIPDNTHSPIVYPCAITAHSNNKEISSRFLNFLGSSSAEKVFAAYHFKVRAN